MELLRLPRGIEDAPGCEDLIGQLASRSSPLWKEGPGKEGPGKEGKEKEAHALAVEAELGPALRSALRSAFSAGRIVRGLESAQQSLAAEQRGLAHVDQKTGVERGGRVSRLVVLSNDGSERFYRNVEGLLRQHAPRVLAMRLASDEHQLGELVCGQGRARLLMVAHKKAVSDALQALAGQWSDAT